MEIGDWNWGSGLEIEIGMGKWNWGSGLEFGFGELGLGTRMDIGDWNMELGLEIGNSMIMPIKPSPSESIFLVGGMKSFHTELSDGDICHHLIAWYEGLNFSFSYQYGDWGMTVFQMVTYLNGDRYEN